MQMRYLLLFWLVAPCLALAEAGIESDGRVPVPLCRALERLEPGDQIPVVVSGIYGINYLYDPEEPICLLDVDRSVCVEFGPDLEPPTEFKTMHKKSLRIFATFSGVLHGAKIDPQTDDPTIPVTARLAASGRSRFCGYQYRAKLVVDSILSFKKVPKNFPWSESPHVDVPSLPFPLKIALPTYPWMARNLEAEGSVLMSVTVVAGAIVEAKVQYGDPILAKEAVASVESWNFEPTLNTSLIVEFEFRLENRPASDGLNPKYEMRLPTYLKVIGARRNW